jgi:hypothetical protein
LNAAPARAVVKSKNNGCVEPKSGRLIVTTPLAAEWRVYANPDLVFGLDAISIERRRSATKTLRLIEGGKLPVGKIAGIDCASREMLRPPTYRNRRQSTTQRAA